MWWVVGLVGMFIFVVLFMLKTAFENNVEQHVLNLNGQSSSKRIFFISDTHTRKINGQMIHALSKPFDAVIIGGDLVDRRTKKEVIHHNLKLLTSLGPTYFVWGNNDREKGEMFLTELLSEYGVKMIVNDGLVMANGNNKLWLIAAEDKDFKVHQLEHVFAKVSISDHVIFVAHNPYTFAKVRKQYKVNLMLGGHLHGGQIRFGPYGLHPDGSYKEVDGCMTLISNGYGTTLLPLRFFARPQCHVINLQFRE